MDEQQAFRAIRNAIRLENLGRDTAAKVTPYLQDAFRSLKAQIAALPEGSINREMRYKELQALIESTLQPASDTLYRETRDALIEEAPKQLEFAADTIREPLSEPFRPQFTRTQLEELATDTEVLGKRLDQLFGKENYFTKGIGAQVDRTVKQGFLLGETNEQIARNLTQAFNGSVRNTRAIARTAVMDMSQRAHERFWDANSDRIKMWEFDATFDYRVCPQCYPYDGKRSKDRGNLKTVPVHPNCRCRVIPLTATALALEKQDMKEGMQISTVQIGKPSHAAGGGGKARRYKTPARVDGKKVDKFAKEYTTPRGERPTMGFFLEKANDTTREAVLGKSKAKHFKSMLKNGISPEDALVTVTKTKGGGVPFKAKPVTKKVAAKPAAAKRKTSDTNYDYDKNWEKLGYEKKSQYRKAKEDIVEWSGNEFEGVRAAQFADARDRGVQLNDYERLQTRRLEKGEQRTAGNRARRLEDFIDRAPKYDGTIRRGVAMDTREEVMSTIERYNSGKKNLAIESWTTDQSVSHRFAMGNGDPRPQRMNILVEGNTKGAPINKISGFDDEYEVLVPSGVRYEVVEVKETFVKGNPKGGPATKMDHTDWTVILREVKD